MPPFTSKYGRTPPNKHGGVGRQQQQHAVNTTYNHQVVSSQNVHALEVDPILPQALQLRDRYDRQEKQYAKGTGGIVLGTGEGDLTADLQRIGEIYRKLCCTNLGEPT